ncbi:MAG: Holliday junction resolvase-like protein [Rhabdochlamydiaceae bacterium]
MPNPTTKLLADFIQTERNTYAQCPDCQAIHRLNEFKIFNGKRPPQDLLDQLRQAQEEFEAKKKKIIHESIEKSKQVYIGKTLEHLAPTVSSFGHQPRDCRFLAEPIDFIAFDGLFNENKVDKITFIDAKTGEADLSPRQKSIRKAVENGKVYFEEFRIESSS